MSRSARVVVTRANQGNSKNCTVDRSDERNVGLGWKQVVKESLSQQKKLDTRSKMEIKVRPIRCRAGIRKGERLWGLRAQ